VINYGVRHLRGQIISLCNVTQFILAGVMAYFIFHEKPAALFYAASVIVVAGVALVVFSTPSLPPADVD
jgi:drug/metabolite transporter (DMT)-like permease